MKKVSKFVVELVQGHIDEFSTYTEYYNKTIGVFDKKPSDEVLDALLEEQKIEVLSQQRNEYRVSDGVDNEGRKVFIINTAWDSDDYTVIATETLIAVD